MHEEEFHLLDRIEKDHWWFVGKRRIVRALLGPRSEAGRVLDLGCGTGGVLRDLTGPSPCFGVDRSELALRICRAKGFTRLVRGDLMALPLREGVLDTVLVLDVIEHLDNDVGFLATVRRLCRPEGRMIVTVPAFQFLWSQHDETFQHRRRYSARQLERTIRAAGLIPERTTYTNFFVFPVAMIWRLLSRWLGLGRFAPRHDFWPIPRVLNRFLLLAYRLEARLLIRYDLPVGVSVACIARVPREDRTDETGMCGARELICAK